jgi:hypothetical protein
MSNIYSTGLKSQISAEKCTTMVQFDKTFITVIYYFEEYDGERLPLGSI